MRRLILMRHGSAQAARAGAKDIDRQLSPSGAADARLIGQVLVREGIVPTKAYVSDAKRTRETWAAAREAFPTAQAQFRAELYNADAHRLLDLVEAEADEGGEDTVLLIGHNPGIHSLAVHLLTQGGASAATVARVERGFPPSTAAAFLVEVGGRMTYDGLFLASEHGGKGGE